MVRIRSLCAGFGVLLFFSGFNIAASGQDKDIKGRFDIGAGRKMYIECYGEGSPVVILEAGFRNSSGIWQLPEDGDRAVLYGAKAMTRVCAYDRPGTTLGTELSSRSDPVPMPRTGPQIVHDLHALLVAAHIPGPYVLVAHSMGGIFSRLYASTYPDSVVGLVLIDAFPEDIAQLMGEPDGSIFLKLVVQVPEAFEHYKDLENVNLVELDELMARTAKIKPLRPMPLEVLARGRPIAFPSKDLPLDFSETLEAAWRQAQFGLASLLPNSRFVIAEKSEHYIQVEQPELVTDAIRRELEVIWSRRERASTPEP